MIILTLCALLVRLAINVLDVINKCANIAKNAIYARHAVMRAAIRRCASSVALARIVAKYAARMRVIARVVALNALDARHNYTCRQMIDFAQRVARRKYVPHADVSKIQHADNFAINVADAPSHVVWGQMMNIAPNVARVRDAMFLHRDTQSKIFVKCVAMSKTKYKQQRAQSKSVEKRWLFARLEMHFV